MKDLQSKKTNKSKSPHHHKNGHENKHGADFVHNNELEENHTHDHEHENSQSHIFKFRVVEKKKLILSLTLTAVVMVIELIGGYITNSIALISDAGHMFTHCFAIGIGLGAIIISQRPPCHHRTFGMYRAEVLAAFVNGIFLLILVVVILYEAILRLIDPIEVFGFEMMLIGIIGLATNLLSIYILHGSHKTNLNIRSVFLHMIADAVASVGVVGAAVIIYYTGFYIIDPLVSIGISIIILVWAYSILKESSKILLELAPEDYDSDTIAEDLKRQFPEIKEIFGSHVWAITMDMYIYYAHVSFKTKKHNGRTINKINDYLSNKYKIIESTIQIDTDDEPHVCYFK
jgi:cobalt-zinc-cadmium efflux system protein